MTAEANYSVSLLQKEFNDRQPVRQTMVEAMARHVPTGGRVIELGSGLGFNLEELASKYRTFGIEGLAEAARQASARGIETIQADLENAIPLPAGEWDAALCLDVLEHLVNPLSCIREAHRLLTPSGILIINIPNHFTLSSRLRMFFGKDMDAPRFFPESDVWNYPHIRFFKASSLKHTLQLGGFSVIEDLSAHFPAVPVLRKIPPLQGLCRSLGSSWPDLFCGGFFLVLQKR